MTPQEYKAMVRAAKAGEGSQPQDPGLEQESMTHMSMGRGTHQH
jgi:hypothetical protein